MYYKCTIDIVRSVKILLCTLIMKFLYCKTKFSPLLMKMSGTSRAYLPTIPATLGISCKSTTSTGIPVQLCNSQPFFLLFHLK